MNPLGRRIIVLLMLWVLLVMVVTQVYDNVTGRGATPRPAAVPTTQAAAGPDATIQKIADAQACIANDPNNLQCLLDLGNLYYGLGQYPQAQTAYEQVIKLDPHNAGVLVKLAGAYIRQGEFDKALPTLEQATALQPNSPELHLLLGLALDKATPPQRERAVSEWRQVVALAPGSKWAEQAAQYISESGAAP